MSRSLALTVEELNEFFVGGAVRIGEDADELESPRSIHTGFNESNFYWNHVTPWAIGKALSHMRSNPTGSDGISLRMIRLVLPVIMPVLEHVCNYSFMQGIYPEVWKSALICPVPKVKNPVLASY